MIAKGRNDVALYVVLRIKIKKKIVKIRLSIVDIPEGIIRGPHKEASRAQTIITEPN